LKLYNKNPCSNVRIHLQVVTCGITCIAIKLRAINSKYFTFKLGLGARFPCSCCTSAVFFLRFLKGCRGTGGALSVNTIFLAISDTFNRFSQKRVFPSKCA